MSEDSPDGDPLDSVDTGLDALTLVDVARDLFEAIDVEALQNGVAVEEAVDGDGLRDALGGPAGKLVARRLADRVVGSGVTGLVAREAAGRAGASLVTFLVERVDPETVGEAVEGVAEETAAATEGDDPTVIDIEDEE
ncbi:hypothetical protein [Halomarina oriensis]|uniref:Uncharacterized protein n=1 Tax=Halomarina oriensis TaxID=671145 RepID=A0A6B0GG20_9EURY|nr:hypothetical protein [Halomarina oriensis]MWG33644.1 hypothetical protein [Halomarina oriensis]